MISVADPGPNSRAGRSVQADWMSHAQGRLRPDLLLETHAETWVTHQNSRYRFAPVPVSRHGESRDRPALMVYDVSHSSGFR
ncbi:hypothetical protein J6590_057612 [Homalodisca vitripennis]|nr:hypothetical protein J6590_057612 [Homalodisca vitripennis]